MALYDNWTWDGTTLTMDDDDVKGYDEEHAYNFADIQACITAKGWTVDWTEVTPNTYVQGMRIVQNSCWFKDTDKVLLQKASINYNKPWVMNAGAYLILGELIDAVEKTTRKGCVIFSAQTVNGALFFRPQSGGAHIFAYGCAFKNVGKFFASGHGYAFGIETYTTDSKIYNCLFDGCGLSGLFGDVYNIVILNAAYAVPPALIAEKITTMHHSRGIQLSGSGSRTVRNCLFVDPYEADFFMREVTAHMYAINVECDWLVVWYLTSTHYLYRQYEFDVHCQDKNGNDLSGVSVVAEYISPYGQAFSTTTDANGGISTQIVDHGFFDQANGSTEQLKTPLKVTYSKAGYQTVIKYYDLNEKTKDVVVMHKAVGVFLDFGRPIVNLKKTDPENKNVMVVG